MKAREYISPVVDGKLTDNVRIAIATLLSGLEGKIVRVSVCIHRARRSSVQSGYYWAVVIPHWKMIFQNYGNIVTDDEVHSYLRTSIGKLFKPVLRPDGEQVIRNDDGVPVFEPQSTGELNTKEFSEYVEACRAEAATEHGHDIPPPDKFYREGKDL